MPFDAGGEGGEGGGSRGEVGRHAGEGVESGAFDYVQDGVAEEGGPKEVGVSDMGDDGTAEAVADEKDVGNRGPGEVCFAEVDDGD